MRTLLVAQVVGAVRVCNTMLNCVRTVDGYPNPYDPSALVGGASKTPTSHTPASSSSEDL